MKIEIVESLGYSFLRHVKQCWLVQANWKASEHWKTNKADDSLQDMFREMKERFDGDGSVFGQTKDAGQLLRQAEIDVLGLDQAGSIHALEVAFHENGLNYGRETGARVLKKLLRTVMALKAYHPPDTKLQIYFASPKVNPIVQQPLEDTFKELEMEYPEINWSLITNDDFTIEIVLPTLEKADTVADTSELFVRAAKLLKLNGIHGFESAQQGLVVEDKYAPAHSTSLRPSAATRSKLQPLVRDLMTAILEGQPRLLDDVDIRNMMRTDYCKNTMGINIANLPLLRRKEDGKTVEGHTRYWTKVYANSFYVCSQWWKEHHLDNAKSLLRFATELSERKPDHPRTLALESCKLALHDYIG